MGKYMRKRKGVGEVAVMDMTLQGSMGVRTRARTLALEQDRKLAQQAQDSDDEQDELQDGEEEKEEEVKEGKDEKDEEKEEKDVDEEVEKEEEEQQEVAKGEDEAEEAQTVKPAVPAEVQQKQAAEPLPATSFYLLRSRTLEKATPVREGNSRKRTSAEVRVGGGGEEGGLKSDGGHKFKQTRYSRMRPSDAAARNPSDVEASNEGRGGSGGRRLRPSSTRGRSSGAAVKAPLSELSGTKRAANTRSNATSLPRNRNSKVPKIPAPEAEALEEAATAVASSPPAAEAAAAAASPVSSAAAVANAAASTVFSSGALDNAAAAVAEVDVVDGHSPQQRELVDVSEGQHPKSLEVEASFGDNAFCDNAMEQDRFSAKDSGISRPSTRSRNVRESTPSSYSRDQEGDAPEACSRLPTPQDGGSWRPCSRRCLFEAPTVTELDDFFSDAEGREHQRFAARYNFDPVNDVPLPGRFEWVKVEESKASTAAAEETSPVLPQEPGA